MKADSSRWLLVFVCLLFTLSVRAEGPTDLRKVIPLIKPSVVAVGTFQLTRSPQFRFLGTGFAVKDGTIIVTNAHVVPGVLDLEERESLAVALPGDGRRTLVRLVQSLASDPAHDLALLKLPGEPLPALSLASERDGASEGQPIGFTGFPIGAVLGLTPVTHAGIVSAITPIVIPQGNARTLNPAVIRRLGDAFDVLQLDATAYPGNSGSPVFDVDSGKVLGIVNMVFVKGSKENVLTKPSGITYAIPVRYLDALLAKQ